MVFTVARYHSLVVLERSRIATRLSVSCGASDSHSLVMLILLHARRGIVVVVCLHARRGIVVVVFLPALHHLRYARQTSLMRGGLPSCPVRPSVYAVVFRSARHGMRGGLPFCSARCHEPGATGSLAPAPVPLSPLSPCGSSSFPLPQPRSSSALRRLDRSLPYRSGSNITNRWPV